MIPLEGRSLVPMLRYPTIDQPRKLYWSWLDNRAHRDGRWELYEIEADRGEMQDRAAEHPERLQALIRDWESWANRTGAGKRLGQPVQLKRR